MAQDLPFINFTADDIAGLEPVNSQCTVKCEIVGVSAKQGQNGTNMTFKFVVVDDNSPEKGKPAFSTFPLAYPTMFAPIMCAALRLTKGELKDVLKLGAFNPAGMIGKTAMVKFDLAPMDKAGTKHAIKPVDFFRDDMATPI